MIDQVLHCEFRQSRKLGRIRVTLTLLEQGAMLKEFITAVSIIDRDYDKNKNEMIYLCEGEQFSPVDPGDIIPFYSAQVNWSFDFIKVDKN